MEGESLFNDASSIVLFQIFFDMVRFLPGRAQLTERSVDGCQPCPGQEDQQGAGTHGRYSSAAGPGDRLQDLLAGRRCARSISTSCLLH